MYEDLGRGRFCVVHHCYSSAADQSFACKSINIMFHSRGRLKLAYFKSAESFGVSEVSGRVGGTPYY
ncbi:hypothetical protein ACP275_06G076200 [Erythranthe tilingii]